MSTWNEIKLPFRDALVSAFNRDSLARVLQYHCDRRLDQITSTSVGFERNVDDVIAEAVREGWLEELAQGAVAENLGHESLNNIVPLVLAGVESEGKAYYQTLTLIESSTMDADSKAGGLPGWIWWAGALALLVIIGVSVRNVLINGNGPRNDEAADISVVATIEEVESSRNLEATVTHVSQDIETVAPTKTSTATVLVNVEIAAGGEAIGVTEGAASATATPQPSETPILTEPPTEEPTNTQEPSKTFTEEPSPTPPTSPNVPPLNAGLGEIWIRPADGMTMVYVPEGSFPMGSEDGGDNEKPVHDVSLDDFWIDRTEVTNAQFARFVEAAGYETTAEKEGSGSVFAGKEWIDTEGADWQHPIGRGSDLNGLEHHPVVLVSWYDAEAYCSWAGARLPSEAEWEYSVRGPQGNEYPWGNTAPNCDLVQFRECEGEKIPTGSLPEGESWVGALDLSGNVWNWGNDWYDGDYYTYSPANNPQGPNSGRFKVLRGGSWHSREFNLRGANRNREDLDLADDRVGFRCVVSPSE